jgi:hypothetical protein
MATGNANGTQSYFCSTVCAQSKFWSSMKDHKIKTKVPMISLIKLEE